MVKTCLSLMAAAFIIIGLSDAALAFDGSTYLYSVLENQRPHTPNNRLVNLPLHVPVLMAAHVTSNMATLRLVFGLTYAAIPLIALSLSWWVVRERAPWLFVWPMIGFGLVILPGQFYLISEGIFSLQLAWPVALSVLVGLPRRHLPIIACCLVMIIFAHPFALFLVGFATFQAFLVGWRRAEERDRMWHAALLLSAVCAAYATSFALTRSSYEAEQLSLAVLVREFRAVMLGLPLLAAASTWLAVAALYSRALLYGRPGLQRLLLAVELGCMLAVGLLLTYWVSGPARWRWAPGYRWFAFIQTLLLMALVTYEHLHQQGGDSLYPGSDWPHRSRASLVVSVVFLTVLSTQAFVWRQSTDKLRQALAAAPSSCVSLASMSFLEQTAFSWATPVYSLLIQGRVPDTLVLPGDGCYFDPSLADTVSITPFEARGWEGGWFDLLPVRRKMTLETRTDDHCWYQFGPGWYSAQSTAPDYWWRWSTGSGVMRIFIPGEATDYTIKGDIETIVKPNDIIVRINGKVASRVAVSWEHMGPLEVPSISLRRGLNKLEFLSMRSGTVLTGDTSPKAFAVANLRLRPALGNSICQLRP